MQKGESAYPTPFLRMPQRDLMHYSYSTVNSHFIHFVPKDTTSFLGALPSSAQGSLYIRYQGSKPGWPFSKQVTLPAILSFEPTIIIFLKCRLAFYGPGRAASLPGICPCLHGLTPCLLWLFWVMLFWTWRFQYPSELYSRAFQIIDHKLDLLQAKLFLFYVVDVYTQKNF